MKKLVVCVAILALSPNLLANNLCSVVAQDKPASIADLMISTKTKFLTNLMAEKINANPHMAELEASEVVEGAFADSHAKASKILEYLIAEDGEHSMMAEIGELTISADEMNSSQRRLNRVLFLSRITGMLDRFSNREWLKKSEEQLNEEIRVCRVQGQTGLFFRHNFSCNS